MLNPQGALDAARGLLTGPRVVEAPRLKRINDALKPTPLPGEFRASVQIPDDAPVLMKELARKSDTNYLPLLVKTFGQVLKVDGYITKTDEGARSPWWWWQANRGDSWQTGPHRSALKYGVTYATALLGQVGRNQGVRISGYTPREMTAVYAQHDDEWPLMAVAVRSKTVELIDEEAVYRFGIEDYRGIASAGLTDDYIADTGWLTYIDHVPHGLGVPPIVRYRDRNLLAGEEQYGIVEPLLTIHERINETTFQMMVAQYFQAFQQRYVIGWVPASEQEELKAGAARMWYLDEDPADVRIDQLTAGAVAPYIESRNAAIRDLAAIGQIPAQALGIDGISNISDATLAGLEAAKNRETNEIATSLGESHEQLLRLVAYIDGNVSAAEDVESEVRWRDYEARSFAQTVDGLVKLKQGLGLPTEVLLEDVPGMTGQKLDRALAAVQAARGRDAVTQLLAGRGNASPTA